ncbi:MAG: SDR family NAD(P)-dependent oxidoreductase [Planctomycetia bacterium]|nr:SDR family NAD(P)-dependent oxidoreductase [Planctomycetia bacterium]
MMNETPVSLVTGASRGIGWAIALALARLGHAVAVNYLSSREAVTTIVSNLLPYSTGERINVDGGFHYSQAVINQRKEREPWP